MKKILFIFIVLFAFSIPTSAISPRLNDDADLLTETEESEISTLLDGVSSETGFDLVIVTTNITNGQSVIEYADDYYDNNGFGNDGILFLIDMENREWWISTSGDAINKFSDSTLDYIGEETVLYLGDGNYYQAFKTFISLSETYINKETDYDYNDNYNSDYDYGYDYNYGYNDSFYDDFYYENEVEYNFGTTLIVSLVAGFIIALIYVSSLKSKLTSVGSQKSASNYAVNNSLQIAATRDNFLYKNISRVPRARNNNTSSRSGRSSGSSITRSSGGGHSVHRSSSGRSHGGRGGKF